MQHAAPSLVYGMSEAGIGRPLDQTHIASRLDDVNSLPKATPNRFIETSERLIDNEGRLIPYDKRLSYCRGRFEGEGRFRRLLVPGRRSLRSPDG